MTADFSLDPDLIRASIKHSTVDRLLTCPPVDPLPAQLAILHAAVRRARAAGLQLPAFRVRWVGAGRDGHVCGGCVELREDSAIVVTLNADAMPGHLERTIYHELQHVADYASGLHRRVSREELERRACAFAVRVGRRLDE